MTILDQFWDRGPKIDTSGAPLGPRSGPGVGVPTRKIEIFEENFNLEFPPRRGGNSWVGPSQARPSRGPFRGLWASISRPPAPKLAKMAIIGRLAKHEIFWNFEKFLKIFENFQISQNDQNGHFGSFWPISGLYVPKLTLVGRPLGTRSEPEVGALTSKFEIFIKFQNWNIRPSGPFVPRERPSKPPVGPLLGPYGNQFRPAIEPKWPF